MLQLPAVLYMTTRAAKRDDCYAPNGLAAQCHKACRHIGLACPVCNRLQATQEQPTLDSTEL